MERLRSTGRRRGFTLIELMVVVVIILVLVLVTAPSVKALVQSAQAAQAENVVRSMLMSARLYAIRNHTIAGVRFQEDGAMVLVYAANAGANFSPDDYSGMTPYELRAVPDIAPEQLPGPYRPVALLGGYVWPTSPQEWCRQWCLYPLVLFRPSGGVMFAECKFPADWYPTSTGAFGEMVDPILYRRQNTPAYIDRAPFANTAVVNGPSLVNAMKIIDVQEFLAQDTAANQAKVISGTGNQIELNIYTGMVTRERAYQSTGSN